MVNVVACRCLRQKNVFDNVPAKCLHFLTHIWEGCKKNTSWRGVGGGWGGGGVAPPNVVFVGKRGRLSENLCSSSSKENVWCDGRSTHFYISDNFYKKWRQNFEKLRKKIASSPTRLDHCPLKWQDLVKKIVMSVIAYSANVRQCVLSSVSSLALIDTLR